MADSHHDGHGHHGPSLQTYLVIGGALAVFTIVSFVVNGAVHSKALTINQGFWIILSVAIVKATLVIVWFMHLLWDWKKVGFMIVPALILGAMMSIVLYPDIVAAWHHDYQANHPAAEAPTPEH